jgi:hypothetical protein
MHFSENMRGYQLVYEDGEEGDMLWQQSVDHKLDRFYKTNSGESACLGHDRNEEIITKMKISQKMILWHIQNVQRTCWMNKFW